MAARYPYFLLADTPEGARKEMGLTGNVSTAFDITSSVQSQISNLKSPITPLADIRRGFVYKRVPHITLKSIANNTEIDDIHARHQPALDALRAEINRLSVKTWQEWEVPRELQEIGDKRLEIGDKKREPLKAKLAEWWGLRRERQQEIDASIARAADTELLYDQPYEDNKRVRVSGPFTVESLSPHRVLAMDESEATPGSFGKPGVAPSSSFENMILDNLRDSYAGEWIHAAGAYTDAQDKSRRVAVCIGPEHGTVGPDLIKDAAKEAVMGIGFDLLVICGFAFDPHVSEEAKRYGKLNVLLARMNPDLAMGDELLKKTGAGNLFMVFGEPDVVIRAAGATGATVNGRPQGAERAPTPQNRRVSSVVGAGLAPAHPSPAQYVVEVRGVDVYDPTTGQIRSSSTDDIACWFIDTDYTGESFFVRHAYFTGADQPYERLKRALRAEIDEAAWASLYATVSRPFDKPASGKIAVKVINHYGDEVLKVYDVK
jgi:adenine-specific DNA-methyltransferase